MYAVEAIGSTGSPLVVIDDFHPEPERLRAMAQQSTFRRLGPYYPGVQASADPRHLAPVEGLLTTILAEVFGATASAKVVQCSFSLVTTPPSELAPIQRLPHVDTTNPGRIALLHYLSDTPGSGTAFYRHRATGLDVLTEENFETYKTALDAEGEPGPGYVRGSGERFEQIGRVDGAPNRAVLYRSQLLHSGIIPEGVELSDDPAQGRLTLNTFFQT